MNLNSKQQQSKLQTDCIIRSTLFLYKLYILTYDTEWKEKHNVSACLKLKKNSAGNVVTTFHLFSFGHLCIFPLNSTMPLTPLKNIDFCCYLKKCTILKRITYFFFNIWKGPQIHVCHENWLRVLRVASIDHVSVYSMTDCFSEPRPHSSKESVPMYSSLE